MVEINKQPKILVFLISIKIPPVISSAPNIKTNGFNIEDILQTNINKLQSRYPEKFTTEKALNRNLNVEREILEQ